MMNSFRTVCLVDPIPEPALSDIVQGAAWDKGDPNFKRTKPLLVARVDWTGENVLLYDGEHSCAASITPDAQKDIPLDALPLNGRVVRVAGYAERQNIPDNAPIVLHITHIRVLPGARLGKPHIDDLVDVAHNRTVKHLLYGSNHERPPTPQEESDTSTISISNSEMDRMFPAIVHAALTRTSLPMTAKPRNSRAHHKDTRAGRKRRHALDTYQSRKKTKRISISSSSSSSYSIEKSSGGGSDIDYNPGRKVQPSGSKARIKTRSKTREQKPKPVPEITQEKQTREKTLEPILGQKQGNQIDKESSSLNSELEIEKHNDEEPTSKTKGPETNKNFSGEKVKVGDIIQGRAVTEPELESLKKLDEAAREGEISGEFLRVQIDSIEQATIEDYPNKLVTRDRRKLPHNNKIRNARIEEKQVIEDGEIDSVKIVLEEKIIDGDDSNLHPQSVSIKEEDILENIKNEDQTYAGGPAENTCEKAELRNINSYAAEGAFDEKNDVGEETEGLSSLNRNFTAAQTDIDEIEVGTDQQRKLEVAESNKDVESEDNEPSGTSGTERSNREEDPRGNRLATPPGTVRSNGEKIPENEYQDVAPGTEDSTETTIISEEDYHNNLNTSEGDSVESVSKKHHRAIYDAVLELQENIDGKEHSSDDSAYKKHQTALSAAVVEFEHDN